MCSAAKMDIFSADFVHLQKMMPEEIWKLVIKKLLKGSANDLNSLGNSSLFFRELLTFQRNAYLFENVFNLVASTVWNKEGLEGLPVAGVLECRTVCSQWSNAVDKLILLEFQKFGQMSKDSKLREVGNAFKAVIGICDSSVEFTNYVVTPIMPKRSVHNFLNHFEQTHPGNEPNGRNPFIWENVTIDVVTEADDDEEIEDCQAFLEGISTLLSKYGSHIKSFTLKIHSYQFFENPSWFPKWLLQMPKLKSLSFTNDSEDSEWDIETDLEEYLEANPFPKLNLLEDTYIEKLPVCMIQPLVSQSNFVTKLVIYVTEDDYDIFSFQMPNLRELRMHFCPVDVADKLASPVVQWPLETLYLQIDKFDDCTELFEVIQQKFADTLVYLSIDMTESENKRGSLLPSFQTSRLNLPKLRNICVETHGSQICLDFLLPMKNNLEKLSVELDYSRPSPNTIAEVTDTNGVITQFHGFEGKMLDSNIWMIFRKLNTIEIVKRRHYYKIGEWLYSRKDWMMGNMYT